MHHKHRKPTTRRWGRRYASKEYRQQERRALDGGRVRNHPWDQRQKSLPLGDLPSNGKVRGGKKQRKPKDKCLPGQTHTWYKEWIETRDWTYPWGYCYLCESWDCQEHREKRWYTERTDVATCINCWTQKSDYPERIYDDGCGYYGCVKKPRKNTRPHRPQNLYEG